MPPSRASGEAFGGRIGKTVHALSRGGWSRGSPRSVAVDVQMEGE
jgi:hypothetical protein